MRPWREVETNGRKEGPIEGSRDQWEKEWEHGGKLRRMRGRMGSWREFETRGRNNKIIEVGLRPMGGIMGSLREIENNRRKDGIMEVS